MNFLRLLYKIEHKKRVGDIALPTRKRIVRKEMLE